MSKAIKSQVSVPVIAVNTVKHPQFAEQLLEEGVSDFVGMSRMHIADPYLVQKTMAGREDLIRKCLGCMNCNKSVVAGKNLHCAINPVTGRATVYGDENLVKTGAGRTVAVVGGGPGGVAFGLKMLFGDAAHCFFAEPTHSPCMMLGMATGENNSICVQDFGIDNRTAADGLAVGRASGFVGGLMRPFMSGCYTLQDERMYTLLAQLADAEDLYLEPSALAGMYGPVLTQPGQLLGAYTEAALPAGALANATHLVWATGGNMVPREEMQRYYAKGRALAQG